MQWNRSNAIGIAKASCVKCQGLGLRTTRGTETPCQCVFRGVFKACWNRFRECVALGNYGSSVSLEFSNGMDGRRCYSRKREEYMADFCLVARRSLNEEEYRVFRFHYLLGANWRMCCQRLKIDRGEFFHQVYHMEEKLGRVYAELEPYALYPTDDYFHDNNAGAQRVPCIPRQPREFRAFVA